MKSEMKTIVLIFMFARWTFADKVPAHSPESTIRSAIQACQTYSKLPRNEFMDDFPWMAALGYLSQTYQISFNCGGTVISDQFILTAAHCVTPSRSPVVVRLGKSTLNDTDGIRPVNHQIQEIIRHKEYSDLTTKNDIALIRLSTPIEFTVNIVPACLQTDTRDENADVQLIETGWGRISSESTKQSNELLKIQLQTMSLDECNKTMINLNVRANSPALFGGVSEGQYCAYDAQGRNGNYRGLGGGPLQYRGKDKADLATVVGIISLGVTSSSEYPGIYTRVAYYLDWIESIVWPNTQ